MFKQIQTTSSSFSSAKLLFKKQVMARKQTKLFSSMPTAQGTGATIEQEIERHQQAIFLKTEQGRSLVQGVAARKPFDKFEREQRYELFITKMLQLQKSERRFDAKAQKAYKRMQFSPLISQTPIKSVLSEYNKLTVRGFDCDVLANSLKYLSQTIQAKGNCPKVYADYSLPEMDISWRFDKVSSDVKFALQNDTQFFSATNMALSSRHLGDIGYKNTEMISIWFDKLDRMLQGSENLQQNLTLEQAVYGDKKNFVPRHYIFKGFETDQEFGDHLQTLINWQDDKKTYELKLSEDGRANQEAAELEAQMLLLIEATNELKDLQTDQQAAIDTLRNQYFKLQQAQDKHEFLQENDYIRLELLELQELLVKGGYVNPDEVLRLEGDQLEQSLETRMEKASQVFYDSMQNFQPELLSTQHQMFIDAVDQTFNKQREQPPLQIEEKHNSISLGSLSSTLVGLSQQALSHRRDAVDNDYPNKFYERYLLNDEHKGCKHLQKREQYVLMERSYLNGWTTFQKRVATIIPHFKNLVQENPTDLTGHLSAFRALSACKQDQRELRDQIIKNITAIKKENGYAKKTPLQPVIDGLVGLAESEYVPDSVHPLIKEYITPVLEEQLSKVTFNQAIDILYGMALLDVRERKLQHGLMTIVDQLNYYSSENEISYEQHQKLYDVHQALQLRGQPTFTNPQLRMAIEAGPAEIGLKYSTEALLGMYDPLKPRLLAGLAHSLNKSNVDQIHLAQKEDVDVLNSEQYGYKPDLVIGYKGSKVGLFVLNSRNVMDDTKKPDGRTAFQMRLNEEKHALANHGNKVSVGLPMDSVIDYDLSNYSLSLKKNFDLYKFMDERTINKDGVEKVNYSVLAEFASNLAHLGIQEEEKTSNSGNFDNFIMQLYQVFQSKDKLENQLFDEEQIDSKRDELKFQLLKLQLLEEIKLSKKERKIVRGSLPDEVKHFGEIIDNLRQQIQSQPKKENRVTDFEELSTNWLGTRLEVELPVKEEEDFQRNTAKSITVELLNRSFLTNEDYHHYADWKEEMEQTFDQLNMLQIPHNTDEAKFHFDPVNHKRRIPRGIFPFPNHKRPILEKSAVTGQALITDKDIANKNDRFVKFERDPLKYMIDAEFAKQKELRDISDDVSMITNLQNIKQGLKADYTDDQIAEVVFSRLAFKSQLIEEHLSKKKAQAAADEVKFVPRKAKDFRSFVSRQNGFDSPFDHFYLKEALKQNKAHELYNQIETLNKTEPNSARVKELTLQMEDILMRNERENEDNFNLSKALDSYVKVDYDLSTLGINKDKSMALLKDSTISDGAFIKRERCRAETRLIKASIIFKKNEGVKLTQAENAYLDAWMKEAKKSTSLVINDDLMVPREPSSLNFSAISGEDLYTLNSIPRVELKRENHNDYALNDLVLELSHFVDPETIRRVELSCLQDSLREKWELSADFQLVNTRNKEVELVLQELEETAWRISGQFNEKDVANIHGMVDVGRGLTKVDRTFWEMDKESLNEFLSQTAGSDKRIELLERWLIRKEEEIKTRVNLPTPDLQKSDSHFYDAVESEFKPARERLVSQLLVNDEFGNELPEKAYKDLTSQELHLMAESLVARINLFDRNYPAFVPQMVRGIMEHQNLQNSDRNMLDTYCSLFELDWRGDRTVANREQFLGTHPIYVDKNQQNNQDVHNAYVRDMLVKACQPYLPRLTKLLLQTKQPAQPKGKKFAGKTKLGKKSQQ